MARASVASTLRFVSASALALAAGHAQAAVFTFTPLCNSNWSTICNLPPGSCGVGGILSRNNWAQTACNATPLFPGGGDDVVLGVNGTIDVSVGARTITINSGVSFSVVGGIATSNGVINNGTASTSGAGNLNYVGPFTNNAGATWIENSNTRFLAGTTFTNAGTLELQSINLQNNGGTNLYLNSATIRKTTASAATFTNIPVTNNATIDVQAGSLSVNGNTYTGSATSVINVATAAASFNLNGYTLVGRVNGTGPGEINSTGVTASGPAIFNVASNLRLNGDLNANAIAGSSITNTNRLTTSGAGNLNYFGSITNASSGLWVENSNNRFFANCSFTNAGTLELQSINLQSNGGTNLFTNTGTVRKVGASAATFTSLNVNNSGLFDVQAGPLTFSSLTYTGSGSGSVNVASGAACNFNDVTIGGTILFTGAGTLASNGGLSVTGNASLNTTSAFRLLSNVTVGAGNSLTNRGLLSTSGAGNLNYVGTLTNGPTGTWIENSNNRYFFNSSLVNNGLLELQSINLQDNGGTNSVTNNATIRKTGASSASFTSLRLNNNAALNVEGGTLNLNSTIYTGIPAANINVSSGATCNLNSMTLAGTVNCTGTGALVSNGNLTVSGNVTTTTTAALQVLSNVTVTAGNSLANQGLVSTSGAGNLNYVGPIVNGNNGTWIENSNNRFFANGTFVNNGTWELQSINLQDNGGTNLITNNATARKTGAAAASFTSLRFTNNSAFNVLAGSLNFNSTTYTGNGAAAFNITSPASVNFVNMTVAGTVRATGTGSIGSSGGISASGNAVINTAQTFEMNSNIGAGGVGNSLTNAGSLSTSGSGNLSYVGAIVNTGTWIENSNNRFFANAIFTNQGTLDLRSINLADNGGTNALNNSGTIRKTTVSTATSNIPIVNSGLIDVEVGPYNMNGAFTQTASGAVTRVRSGATLGGGGITFAGGSVQGRGTISQAVSITGATLNPGDVVLGGTLSINGPLSLGTGSTTQIDIGAPSSVPFDRVQATGTVAVNGALVINMPSPFYPNLGDVYEIVRTTAAGATPRTGTFSSVTLNADPGIAVAVSYTSNSVRITVTDTTCDPIDFNRDGLFPDDQDLIDFLNVLAGGSCSTDPTPGCSDVDFNNDGLFPDDSDLVDFLTVLAGGPCSV